MNRPQPSLHDVAAWLREHHGGGIAEVQQLAGGFWSTAYGYVATGRRLVLRLGTLPEGFEADRLAMAFTSPDLPVPTVLHVGRALGWACAISVRHDGLFLEDTHPGPLLGGLLGALRAVPQGNGPSWRAGLLDLVTDDPKAALLSPPHARLHELLVQRIRSLIPSCPERRDLVHGDLLHQNVLVDTDHISAIFSWKCAVRGDHPYDTAWCTFWAPWYPGIEAADAWAQTPEPGPEAALRHHCYELHIAATHLGWMTWTGEQDLARLVDRAEHLLDRG